MALALTVPANAFGQHGWFERNLLPGALKIALWSYAAFAAICAFGGPVDRFDDSIPLVDGMLVGLGRTPNLDFYSFYPPLSYYFNAAAFKLFGLTIVGPRLFCALLYLAVVFFVTRFLRLQFPQAGVLVPTAGLLAAAIAATAITLPAWPGFALSFITLLLYLCSDFNTRSRLLLVGVSGVLTAITLLYRVNFGGYVGFVIAIDLVSRRWVIRDRPLERAAFASTVRELATFASSVAVCCLALCLSIYGQKAFVAVPQFVMNAQRLMTLRGFLELSLSPGLACALVLPAAWFFLRLLAGAQEFAFTPFAVGTLAMIPLALALVWRSHSSIGLLVVASELLLIIFFQFYVFRLERHEFTILLYFCCLLHYFLSRADGVHWRLLPIAAMMLLPFLLFPQEVGSSRSKGTAFAVLFLAIFFISSVPEYKPQATYARRGLALLKVRAAHPRAADSDLVLSSTPPNPIWEAIYPEEPGEWSALKYLRTRTKTTDPIFIGVQDHSTVFWNHLRMYWLAGRQIGVRSFQLETRVATELPIQTELISDLDRNNVNWMILDCLPERGDDWFALHPYRGSKVLDAYITSHFEEQARFGRFAVLQRVRL